MRKKGITMKAVHIASIRREIPLRGNVTAKRNAASGYPRKENICFSRNTIAWEGSGPLLLMVKTGAGVEISVLDVFPLIPITRQGITQGFSLFYIYIYIIYI